MNIDGSMTLAEIEDESANKLKIDRLDSSSVHHQKCLSQLGFEPTAMTWYFGPWFTNSEDPRDPEAIYHALNQMG